MLKKCKTHLDSVHESYLQHPCFAFCLDGRMIAGGLAAIIHGIFPTMFQTPGSSIIFTLHDEVKSRLNHMHEETHG